jgi:hypothetical protein
VRHWGLEKGRLVAYVTVVVVASRGRWRDDSVVTQIGRGGWCRQAKLDLGKADLADGDHAHGQKNYDQVQGETVEEGTIPNASTSP